MFKMQSVVSVEDKLSVLPKEIFRRRLKIEETMRKTTARCLFGVPDPIETHNFVTQVYESNMMDFETQWNFNLTLGEPLAFPSDENPIKTEDGVESVKSETYYWNEVLEADVMSQTNLHRFDVPSAPNTRPVTLLFAPIDPSLGLGFVPYQKKDTTSEQHKGEIVATKSLSSGQVQLGYDSSSGDLSSSKDPSISRKETRLSPPPMKQRCITDYMRVKKSQQGRKSMR